MTSYAALLFFISLAIFDQLLVANVWAAKQKPQVIVQEVVKIPEVYLAAPPQFVRPDDATYFMAIDIPYDLFYADNIFYLLHRGNWFASDFFEGPWETIGKGKTPSSLRTCTKQNIGEIRRQATQKFMQNKQNWPKEALFIPETIDTEIPGVDDLKDTDLTLSEIDEATETVPNLKGDK